MRNSPGLPVSALIASFVLGAIAIASYASGGALAPNEWQIGLVAVALAFLIFAVEGLLSVALEGQELHLGRIAPRLTTPLSIGIVVLTVALIGISAALGYGIFAGWDARAIGLLAGAGSINLAVSLIFYKEAFIGDESRFDRRNDGVPW